MAMLEILLSSFSAKALADPIAATLEGRAHRLVEVDTLDEAAEVGFEIAFMSRDVSGTSSRTVPSVERRRFFATLARCPSLRWVHIHQAGADLSIWAELAAKGVRVTTSQGANAKPVALSAVGGIIALERRFPDLFRDQLARKWTSGYGQRMPRDLEGQTAVVVGLGPVGSEIARLLRAIGMRVIGVRRSNVAHPDCDSICTFDDMDQYLPGAEWLVLSCPLTQVTRGIIDARRLALLPDDARVVNVARGEVVVERDLIEALTQGRLAGAWLDVFEHEPLGIDSLLWTLPGVVVSPHAASFSSGNEARVAELFLQNLARWRDGLPLRNVTSLLST